MAETSRELSEIRVIPPTAGRTTQVILTGEIDMASRSRLDDVVEKIVGGPPTNVVVDLSTVTFLGSVGLDFLVRLHVRVNGAGLEFAVLNPPPIALQALRATGLDDVFTILGVPPAGE